MKANTIAPMTLEAGLRAGQLHTGQLLCRASLQGETLRDEEAGCNGES